MNRTTQASSSIPLTRPPEIKNNDEQKILVIGTTALTAFRILTAPFRWIWNYTYRPLRNLVRKFGLGRVSAKANRADDLAHYRQRIEQILAENKSPRPPATKPAARSDSHLSLAASSGSRIVEPKYVPLETQDLEDLRGALMNLTKTATDIFYEEHLKQYIDLAMKFLPHFEIGIPAIKVIMKEPLIQKFLILNGPVIPLLLNGSGPSLKDREKKVKQWLAKPENKIAVSCFREVFPDADLSKDFKPGHILYLEHQSMKNYLKDVYEFLLKDVKLQKIFEEEGEMALQLHVKRAGSEDKKEEVAEYFKVIADWMKNGVRGNEPFESWVNNKITSEIDMRLVADCYALLTTRLLKDRTIELAGKRIPGLSEKLPGILDETRETIVPKVADHLIVQGVTALHVAPMDRIIDDSISTFCHFLNASLAAQDKIKQDNIAKKFISDFFEALREKGIHFDPKGRVKKQNCKPFRDILLSGLDSEEGSGIGEGQIEMIDEFLSRILDASSATWKKKADTLNSDFFELLKEKGIHYDPKGSVKEQNCKPLQDILLSGLDSEEGSGIGEGQIEMIDDFLSRIIDASLTAKKMRRNKFNTDLLVLLKEKGIHYSPKMVKSGVTEEWVKDHICKPLRDMLLPGLMSEESSGNGEDQFEMIGDLLFRIANEIKLPKDLRQLANFGYELAKGFMPSNYVLNTIKKYANILFGEEDKKYRNLLTWFREKTPQMYHAFKLFALQQIVDKVLAGVITPRIHTYMQPKKIEKLLGEDILPVVNDTLMKTFIGMMLAKKKNESLRNDVAGILMNYNNTLTEDCLDKVSEVVFKKLQEEFPIGGAPAIHADAPDDQVPSVANLPIEELAGSDPDILEKSNENFAPESTNKPMLNNSDSECRDSSGNADKTQKGYLEKRFLPEKNRQLYREKLQDILDPALKSIQDKKADLSLLSLAIFAVASRKSERKCSPEELRPYQALLQSVIMNAGGFKNFLGGLINTGFNAILNNALAPLMVRALDEYRLNSDEVIRKATSVINEKLLARDPSLPPSNSSDVKETLLYTKFMGPSREEPKKSCEKEAFYPSFKEECELLAAMIYDAARFEAGQKGWIVSKAVTAVLGSNEEKLADVIKSVADPILKRPMVLELLISRVAEDTLRQLHPANRIASTHAEDATESS